MCCRAAQDTSFQMFVGLMCNSLKSLLGEGSTQEWKQMKGRLVNVKCIYDIIQYNLRLNKRKKSKKTP